MLFLTRHFGVTGSEADRDPVREKAEIEDIVEKSLLLQAKSAAQQRRPIGRGTHVKGVCARAQFEVLDVSAGRDEGLAARLTKGIFAKPGVYAATVRFGNADPKKNSDFKADVRSLSFSVDLPQRTTASESHSGRQDFSLQNTNAHQRRKRIPGALQNTDGGESGCRNVGSPVQGQTKSAEDPDPRATSDAPDDQALSTTSLREQCTVSSRTDRRSEIFGHTLGEQSCESSGPEKPKRVAGRIDPARPGRQQNEQLRLWRPVAIQTEAQRAPTAMERDPAQTVPEQLHHQK